MILWAEEIKNKQTNKKTPPKQNKTKNQTKKLNNLLKTCEQFSKILQK